MACVGWAAKSSTSRFTFALSTRLAFGVFIHRSNRSTTTHRPSGINLERARACVGDWIIYYEPRKIAGTKGYYAMAKVGCVIADPSTPGMYLALIESGSYLDCASPAPFADEKGPIEHGVLNEAGRIWRRFTSVHST
jgi:putative restriction endonuclease